MTEVSRYQNYNQILAIGSPKLIISDFRVVNSSVAMRFNESLQIGLLRNFEYQLFTIGANNFAFAVYQSDGKVYTADKFATKKESKFAANGLILKLSAKHAQNICDEPANSSTGTSQDQSGKTDCEAYEGLVKFVEKYSDIEHLPDSLSDVPEYLSSIDQKVRYVRVRVPFTGNILSVFEPYQCFISDIPISVTSPFVIGKSWYNQANDTDKQAYEDWKAPVSLHDAIVAKLANISADKYKDINLISMLFKMNKRTKNQFLTKLVNEYKSSLKGYILLSNNASKFVLDILMGQETGDIAATKEHIRLLDVLSHVDETVVLKSEADANNKLAHIMNGNGVYTVKKTKEEEIITDITTQFDLSEVPTEIRLDQAAILYKWEEIPEGHRYSSYYDFMKVNDLVEDLMVHVNISTAQEVMLLTCIYGYCDDAPKGSDFSQFFGYLWFINQDEEVVELYNKYADKVQDLFPIRYVSPVVNNVINRNYDIASRLRSVHDTSPFKKDLTIYGIERNPGPVTKTNSDVNALRLEIAQMKLSRALKSNESLQKHNSNNISSVNKPTFKKEGKLKPFKQPNNNNYKPKENLQTHVNAKPMIKQARFKYTPKPRPLMSNTYGQIRTESKIKGMVKADNKIAKKLSRMANVKVRHTKMLNMSVNANNVRKVMMNTILPGNLAESKIKTERYGDEYSDQATAVAQPVARYPASTSTAADSSFLNNTDMIFIANRDPFCSLIYTHPNQSLNRYRYNVFAFDQDSYNINATPNSNFKLNIQGTTNIPMCYAKPDAAYPFAPHGTFLYPRKLTPTGANFVYLGKGHTMSIAISINPSQTASSNGADTAIEVITENNGEQVILTQMQRFTAPGTLNLDYPAVIPGYYAFRVFVDNVTGTSATNMQIKNFPGGSSTGLPTMCHRAIPGLENNLARALGIRINGMSMMVKVLTSLNNMNGMMMGCNIPASRSFIELFDTLDSSKFLASTDLVTQSQITDENGMYIWTNPMSQNDYIINTNYEHKNGILNYGFSNMYPVGNQAIIYFQNSGNVALNFEVYDNKWLEYYTEDPWVDTALSYITDEEWKEALQGLKHIRKVTPNPIHWLALVKSILAFTGKYAETTGAWLGETANKLNAII